HTRSYGDWSSDVCSSDLKQKLLILAHFAGRVACRNYGPLYSFILSSLRYSVFLSMPRICAARLLFPPVAASTRRICSVSASASEIGRASCRERVWVSGGH